MTFLGKFVGLWGRNGYGVSFTTRPKKFAKMVAHSSKRCGANFVTIPKPHDLHA
jgi:hypothetical protein